MIKWCPAQQVQGAVRPAGEQKRDQSHQSYEGIKCNFEVLHSKCRWLSDLLVSTSHIHNHMP